MSKLSDAVFEKVFEPVWKWNKQILLGYSASRVIGMKRADREMFLSEGDYFRRKQGAAMLSALYLCVVASIVLLVFSDSCIDWLLQFLDIQNMGVENIFRIWAIFTVHIALFARTGYVFKVYTYGYEKTLNSIGVIKYNVRAFAVIVVCTGIDLCYVGFRNKLAVVVMYNVLMYIVWKVYVWLRKGKHVIMRVHVLSENCSVTNNKNAINGNRDLKLILKNKTEHIVNLYNGDISIVEDQNILLVNDGTNAIYNKEDVECIDVDNKAGIYRIIYDDKLCEWRKTG